MLCSSCGQADDHGRRGQTAARPATSSTPSVAMTVDLKVDPYPPLPMRKALFSLTLTDADGIALRGPRSSAT